MRLQGFDQFFDARDTRTFGRDPLRGDVKLAVDIHQGEFYLIPLRFDVGVGVSINFNEKGSTVLNILNPLQGQSTLLEGGGCVSGG